LLRWRRLSGVIWRQLGCSEWAEMVQVSVQRASQRRALLDQSHSGMTSAMNSPLVPFGLAKPSFQVQVVARQFIGQAQKQAREKAGHQSHYVLGERVRLLGEAVAEFLILTATIVCGAVSRIKRIGNGLDLFHLWPQFALIFLDGRQPAVNAGR
jgi:hypothetical protein